MGSRLSGETTQPHLTQTIMNKYHIDTQTVRTGLCSDKQTAALVPPIHLSTTYALSGLAEKGDYDYSRTANPTRNLLAEAIAELEGGATGIITNTGMSAILLVCQLLKADDLLVIPHDCYGGTYRLFTHLAARGVFQLAVVNQHDESALAAVLAKRPAMLWVETPSNPLLRIYDIKALAKKAKAAGALVAVDNTFLTPLLQRPLDLGADIVTHSSTKFLNGHSDIVSGAVVIKDAELGNTLKWWANCIGVTGSAFDSYMVLRGLRTLPARLRIHEENSHVIADFLAKHPAVDSVYYPGLPSHHGHVLAKQQQQGFGAIISFTVHGGEVAVAILLKKLRIFTQAQSLGGVESLINHPATMTHAAMPDEAKAIAGVSAGLLRLAVGIEAAEDLLADLRQGLDALPN